MCTMGTIEKRSSASSYNGAVQVKWVGGGYVVRLSEGDR